jgi:uncharacterized damage-inducible protein DinB
VTLSTTLITQLQYHRWATGQIMEEAVALSAEQLMTNLKTSFGGVYETIVHLYQSDRIWLDRLEERPSGKFEDYTAPGCVWELSDAWAEVQQQLIVLASGLREADIDRSITYKNLAGQTFSSPIWQILLHVVNHGTHHRGQVTAMIRQLGRTPTNLDLIRYHRSVVPEQLAEPATR